jgi:hypothetical protein
MTYFLYVYSGNDLFMTILINVLFARSYLAAEHDYLLQENQMVDDAVRIMMPSSAVCKRVQVLSMFGLASQMSQ